MWEKLPSVAVAATSLSSTERPLLRLNCAPFSWLHEQVRPRRSRAQKQWHYAADGARLGPVPTSEMSSLIAARRVTRRTLVWSEGLRDWKEAGETELFASSTPPPLTGQSLPNGFAWVLAVLPVACIPILFLGMAVSGNDDEAVGAVLLPLFLLVIADFVFFALDFFRLRRAGHQLPFWTWATPVPVYLFIRASLLRQSPDYAYVWILGFALWILAFTRISWSFPAALVLLAFAVILRLVGVGRRST